MEPGLCSRPHVVQGEYQLWQVTLRPSHLHFTVTSLYLYPHTPQIKFKDLKKSITGIQTTSPHNFQNGPNT